MLDWNDVKEDKEIFSYPQVIGEAYSAIFNASDDATKHDCLNKFSEDTIKYIACISTWEFRNRNELNETVDNVLYKLRRNVSLGSYAEVIRETADVIENSILSTKVSDKMGGLDESVILSNILKEIVKGTSFGIPARRLENYIKDKLKNITNSTKKITILDAINTLVQVRNQKAHPDKIELSNQYYKIINPYLCNAIVEINKHFKVIKEYKCVIIEKVHILGGKFSYDISYKEIFRDIRKTVQDIPNFDMDTFQEGKSILAKPNTLYPYILFKPTELPPPSP